MFLAWFHLLADNYLSAPLSLSLLSVSLQSVSTFIHRAHGLHSLLRTQLLRNSLRRPSDISTRSLHPPSVSSSHQHGLVVQNCTVKHAPPTHSISCSLLHPLFIPAQWDLWCHITFTLASFYFIICILLFPSHLLLGSHLIIFLCSCCRSR